MGLGTGKDWRKSFSETPVPLGVMPPLPLPPPQQKREEGKKEGRAIPLTRRGAMHVFLCVGIKNDLFVSSLIRKNKV